jgi:uncharacterized membrane protein
MNLIYAVATVALLLINLAGLTLLASRWLPPFALARSVGVLLSCLVLFYVEHFIGLGNLTWVWPIITLASLCLIWRSKAGFAEKGFWWSECVFILAFLYGLTWRFTFPDITPSSERITDLYFIVNYLPGNTLPPLDQWYPPHHFNFYYALQHYGAALLGRIFGLDGGTSYNIAFALLMALPITLAWYFSSSFIKSRWPRLLLVLVLITGGTGFSPLMHLVIHQPDGIDLSWSAAERIIAGQRFIGNMELPNTHRITTPLGEKLFPRLKPEQKPTPDFEARELPEETFGYQFFLGDYHPPIGGYFLLILALTLIAAVETGGIGRLGQALLALTVPATIVTNLWIFPLQAFLLAGWIGYRYWQVKPPDWAALIGGGLLGLALIYPFLTGFAVNAIQAPIKLVSWNDHTPFTHFVGLHWPLIVLVVLGLFQPSTRKLSITFALTFGALLLISEFIYIDDPSGGKYERTNTVMKWWGWIWAGGLVSLGTLCLASKAGFIRWSAVLTLVLVSFSTYDLARYYIFTGKNDRGHLSGHYWYTRDRNNRDLFNYLQAAPSGILLENQYDNAYTNTGIHALFTGKTALLGWTAHLMTWHGDVPDVWALMGQIKSFYAGALPTSLDWLLANNVRYVIWSPADNGKHPQAFNTISRQIGSRYVWRGFYEAGDSHVGVWVWRNSE